MNNISKDLNEVYVLLQRVGVAGKDNVRNLDGAMQLIEQIYPAVVDMENELAKKKESDKREESDNVQ